MRVPIAERLVVLPSKAFNLKYYEEKSLALKGAMALVTSVFRWRKIITGRCQVKRKIYH